MYLTFPTMIKESASSENDGVHFGFSVEAVEPKLCGPSK